MPELGRTTAIVEREEPDAGQVVGVDDVVLRTERDDVVVVLLDDASEVGVIPCVPFAHAITAVAMGDEIRNAMLARTGRSGQGGRRAQVSRRVLPRHATLPHASGPA